MKLEGWQSEQISLNTDLLGWQMSLANLVYGAIIKENHPQRPVTHNRAATRTVFFRERKTLRLRAKAF